MHDHRRIGIPGFFSATLVVIHLVFVFMVLKWKTNAAAKKGASRKLVILEAQETATLAEGECEYMTSNSVTVIIPSQYECAVCFRAASKRCARCKALRYCNDEQDMLLYTWKMSLMQRMQSEGLTKQILAGKDADLL